MTHDPPPNRCETAVDRPSARPDALVAGPGSDNPASGSDALAEIAGHALFEGIPLATLAALIAGFEIRSLCAGDVLLAPGQVNQSLYLLLEGQLKVRINNVESEQGFVIGPGECAGEVSAIDRGVATAFVVAEVPSRILVLSEADIWERLFQIPRIARNFLRLLADRFRARNDAVQRGLEQQLRFEHLQKELAIAHDIQLGMLPRDLDLWPEIEIAAAMTPAQQVGGDFYDVFPVGPDECGIAIGDVSGKGVPAALFMVRTMVLLRTELLKDQPVNLALARLNEMLCADNPTCMFATLVVGLLNRRTGNFRYAAAGHDPVLLGTRGGCFRQLPPPSGILVGLDKGATYELATVALGRGDVLLMYTDGITEAMNPEHQLFTFARLMECLREPGEPSAEEIAERIHVAIGRFAGSAPPSDDITMVILRYLGAEAGVNGLSRTDTPDLSPVREPIGTGQE